MDVVGEVIDVVKPGAHGLRIARTEPFELGIVGGALRAVAVDEIEQAAADTLDGGNVERLLLRRQARWLGAECNRALISLPAIYDTERHRWRAGTVRGDE